MPTEIPNTIAELTELFREIGAEDAESWARSQIEEGIPQLHRYLFLRQAWERITADGDVDLIKSEIAHAQRKPDEPYAGLGAALERCIAAGAAPDDLSEIVRCKEAQLLFRLCYLMEDPGLSDVPECIEELGWGLFANEDGAAVGRQISGLHESVLSMDPSKRELRPRKGSSA